MIRHQNMKLGWVGMVFALSLMAFNANAAMDSQGESASGGTNMVESIDFTSQPGGKVVVKITLKQEPALPPAGFATNAPPRVALDFANVGNGLSKSTISAGDGLLRSMTAVQAGNRTRVVLNLSKPSAYTTSVEGRNVLVTLQGTNPAGVSETTVAHFSQAVAGLQGNSLKNVDFQRGKNGEGRVIVDLEQMGSGIDIRQQGKNLVVDFLNTSLPEKMERRLNVTNFATPVLTVDTFKQGQTTRMVIEPKGQWEHSAYQSDRRFIVEVKPIVFDPTKVVQGSKAGFGGEKLSLDFNGIDVKSLLRIIGDFTGKNIVVSDAIQGTITLRLKDVPWDQALDIIMKQKGLGMDNLGNTLVFAPKDEIANRRKQDLAQENDIDDSKQLITQSFSVKYQKAADIKTLISDPKQPLLSKRGSAVVDPVTNTLFVKDIDTSLDKIQEILNKVDITSRQVLIEARIVNASDNFSKSLGARFGIVSNNAIQAKATGQPANGNNLQVSGSLANNYSTAASGVTATPGDLNVNLPATSATGATVSALAFTLARLPAGLLLNAELSAAEADGTTKIISSPRVITANQQQASFDFGQEIPYQQATSSGATSVSFKNAVLGIQVTPQITPDEKIGMDIEVNNDSRGADTTAGPAINTNKVKTKVQVDNGETVVLGGFYTETKQNSNERVPFFGSLPLVGALFRSNAQSSSKQEILFFITPKIISDSLQLN